MNDKGKYEFILKIPNFGKEKSNIKQKSIIMNIGVFINIIWAVSAFFNPPLDPNAFLGIGLISLLLTLIIRIISRFENFNEFLEIQGGGSVFGFIVACFLAIFFYGLKSSQIIIFESSYKVEFILQVFIVLAFLIWFAVPVSQSSQDIIFGNY